MKCKIGIRPIIDGRWGGVREGLEEKTMGMAKAAKELIESNLFYTDGTPVECVISNCTIGGGEEAAACARQFATENVVGTLSVTPCWCYGSETMDLDPMTVKAVWGFNGTEFPGAVYLAAAMSAHAQKGLPAYSIYGHNVQEANDTSIPEDVQEKILRFARCAVAVGQMRNKAYVGVGAVSMGIASSFLNPDLMQKYFNIRAEWVDMTELLRRIKLGIFDHAEYEKALSWVKANCHEGADYNSEHKKHSKEQKEEDWEFCVKCLLILRDILYGNPVLDEMGWHEEALGRNAIAGGFQGQRMWTDWLPNCDFAEAILNTTFDWNGKRQPTVFATENDSLNALAMLFGNLLTQGASVFADVRTFWSPESVERVSGWKPTGAAENGFIHLINSGAAALDGAGCMTENGKPVMKQWWKVTEEDIEKSLEATDWCPANMNYFRGGGFSSHFRTRVEMPVTLVRVNMIEGIGPTLQIAEGTTVNVPDHVLNHIEMRTDPSWPTTFFAPRLTGKGAFKSVYDVMANWGANHGAFSYGHIGKDLITLASMLRIPVSLHNVEEGDIFRPHAWSAFGTNDLEGADFRACEKYGPLYR